MEDFEPDFNEDIRAKVVLYQIQAFAARTRLTTLSTELSTLCSCRKLNLSPTCSKKEIKSYASSAWSTEILLRANQRLLQGDAERFSIQWALPQAYYSVFSIILAHFVAAGYTQRSHAAVIKEFGILVSEKKYPISVSPYLTGGITNVPHNLDPRDIETNLEFKMDDASSVDAQILRALNSVRKADLKNKLKDLNLKTKQKKPKRKFSSDDYDLAASKIGPTSILNYLYKKRIRANYQDISSLVSVFMDTSKLYEALIELVAHLNFVHEAFLFKALGREVFTEMIRTVRSKNMDHLESRLAILENKLC